MNNTELCRANLYKRLGISETKKRDPSQVKCEVARMTAKLAEIKSLAEPRLVMGGIRHGSDWEHEPLMKYMQKKFDDYLETGNFELLVDLFNFVVIEGELKTHPKFNYSPIDRKD